MGIKETGQENVDWIRVPQDRGKIQNVVNNGLDFSGAISLGNILTSPRIVKLKINIFRGGNQLGGKSQDSTPKFIVYLLSCFDFSSSSSLSFTSQALIDLFRPRLIVPSKFFQVDFVYLVCNSVLFLASCCSFFVTCRSQLDLYLISFSSAGSTFNSTKIRFLLSSKRLHQTVLLKNLISSDVNLFFYHFL